MKVHISYGGSHRKNQRDTRKLAAFLVPDALKLPAALNSKRLVTTAFDSPELRAMLKEIGGSICRRQPAYLND